MPYVQRSMDGIILGLYNVAQQGYAEEWSPEDALEVVTFRASTVPVKTVIYKRDIWLRATDDEASRIDARLDEQPVRLRRIWQDSQTLSTADEMYPILLEALKVAFGEERAKALLEPTA